jgi:hypothetical protein
MMRLIQKAYSLQTLSLPAVLLFLPLGFVYAQTVETLEDIIDIIVRLIAAVIPIAFALAILFFFWGIAKFIYFADNEQKRKEGKNILIWGVIAIFILVSIWGIVALLKDTFLGAPPCVPGPFTLCPPF